MDGKRYQVVNRVIKGALKQPFFQKEETNMKIHFENKTGKEMQICIEPFLDYLDWGVDKCICIEFIPITDRFTDDIDVVMNQDSLVIYECRQYEMKIHIDRELKYCTPRDRYL